MAEGVVVLLRLLQLLDGQLQLALHLPHEKVVHYDVVVLIVQLVLYPNQPEHRLRQLLI